MFFVIILVTSCNSLFSVSNPELFAALAVLVSWYSRAVLDMNVSSKIKRVGLTRIRTALKTRTESDESVRLPHCFNLGSIGSSKFF